MSVLNVRSGTVVGVFENPADAQHAIHELKVAGFSESQIGVVSQDHLRNASNRKIRNRSLEEGAIAGAATGLGIGTLWGLGLLAGIVPGFGPAIAGGTLGVLLSSAVTGAATAGVAGALIGLGISEDEARFYEEEFNAGHTIVTVAAGSRADAAWDAMARAKATER